jgi:tRNA modification GTPase
MGNAGIGIIRVSGDRAIEICDKIFDGKKKISENHYEYNIFIYMTC